MQIAIIRSPAPAKKGMIVQHRHHLLHHMATRTNFTVMPPWVQLFLQGSQMIGDILLAEPQCTGYPVCMTDA
ncbi:hypothetical protein SAMN05421881_10309 [Nitrosomonas halophila]|uniref:Uncharacterized protein n=1 Tax=Nitrosomonas halophila TaxID=44576 RepID=A0A1H3J2T1_9PROT|nr:hypothetical protein SAMN05421881_10309 [Nitrosomonas halophila]